MSAIEEFKKLIQQAKDGNFDVEPEVVPEIVEEEVEVPQVSALEQLKNLLREAAPKYIPKEVVEESIKAEVEQLSERDIVQMTADLLSKSNKSNVIPTTPQNIESQRWDDPLRREPNERFVTFKEMNDHYGSFLHRIQQQMSTIGGGGEVNFRYLDDVNRATMTNSDNNHVLEYDAATGKVQFTDVIGPIEQIHFDLNHTHDEERLDGTLCWDPYDQTLNLTHPGGVTQQIGQETYAYVRNGTANTIPNGTPVMFAGASEDGLSGARLLVSPIVADGSFPSLYGLGIATQDLTSGQDGRVTVWGKVRDINTSVWNVGDILYADPFNAGQLTNVKPTAPNNVIPFAAVLKKDATSGEIFVRPTIEQRMYYGRFSRLTNQTAVSEDTATAVQFDTVEIANGITFNGGSNTEIQVTDSGFYQFDLSAQITASSNKGVVYFWFRKNGTDVEHSTRSTTVTNGDTFNVSTTIAISLDINDYVEVMWARSATGIFLDARTATAFAPSSASVMLNVTQVQL